MVPRMAVAFEEIRGSMAVTTVLIADDNALVRAALRELLDDDPAFEVVELADQAESAITAARRHRPGLALVDVRMPGGGPVAAAGILEVSPHTRVVACSAYDDAYSRTEMARAGAVAYLVKGRDDVLAGLRAARDLA
jgi:DNA-binding NarL/FixJ family response regulator